MCSLPIFKPADRACGGRVLWRVKSRRAWTPPNRLIQWVQCPFRRLVAANVPCDGSTCRRPVGPIASLRSVPAPNPYSELGIKEKDSNEEYLVVRTGSGAGAWHDRRCFDDRNTGRPEEQTSELQSLMRNSQ